MTYTSIYSSEDTKNEFVNDSTISTESARRNKINEDNGITKEVTVDDIKYKVDFNGLKITTYNGNRKVKDLEEFRKTDI